MDKKFIKTALQTFLISIIVFAAGLLTITIFTPSFFDKTIQQTGLTLFLFGVIGLFIFIFIIFLGLNTVVHKVRNSPSKQNIKTSNLAKEKEINFIDISKEELQEVSHGERVPEITPHENAENHEIKEFENEIIESKELIGKKPESKKTGEVMPTRIPGFDELIENRGLLRGSTILISGGAGTGKTTFSFETLYKGALMGKKGIYISLEEDVEKIKMNMKRNYGWDITELEKKGLMVLIKMDALDIARKVEAATLKGTDELEVEIGDLELPFVPDRIVIDSLSALELAFGNTESYRIYTRYLFELLEKYNSINFVIGETEQNPKTYSRAGIQEFLADGVIVFYNIQIKNERENAMEILKLRSSKHKKKIVPYEITENGFEVFPDQAVFRE